MSTRTRKKAREEYYEEEFDELDLEALSSEELEQILFDEPEASKNGIFNLPTIAGFSLILVGAGLILERLGVMNMPLSDAALMIVPWLAGILIMLLGFGALSWRPKRKKIRKIHVDMKAKKPKMKIEKGGQSAPARLRKSKDKKMQGVAAGIAEYFNIDPTLVRIAFVISGFLAPPTSFFAVFVAYIILSKILPGPDTPSGSEERITIIRD